MMCGAGRVIFEVAECEGAVFKVRLGIAGDTVGKGMFDGAGDVTGKVGMALDVRVDGSLSDIGTEDRSVGNSDCGEPLDKGNDHDAGVLSEGDDHDAGVLSEMLLSNDAEDEI